MTIFMANHIFAVCPLLLLLLLLMLTLLLQAEAALAHAYKRPLSGELIFVSLSRLVSAVGSISIAT